MKTWHMIVGGLAAAGLGYWGYKRWKQYRVFGPVTATESTKMAVESYARQSPTSTSTPTFFTPRVCPFSAGPGSMLTARNGNTFQVVEVVEYGDDPIFKMRYGDSEGVLHCSDMYKYFPVPGESLQEQAYATSYDVPESEMFGQAPFGIRVL